MSQPPRLPFRLHRIRAASGVVLGALMLSGAGCSGGPGKAAHPAGNAAATAPGTDRYKVTADSTAFYLYGPQEPNGPDETLKKDTKVTMVKRSFGYSRITAPDGKTGYVGTEDIAPLSPEDIADENAALQQMPSAEALKHLGPMPGGYTIPPEAGNDERLPVADSSPTPKPAQTPGLRY